MRALGLDVGDRRIGVALSDALGLTAQPLTVVTRHGGTSDLKAIGELVARHEVTTVVIGLPLTLRGERGAQSQKVVTFSEALAKRLSVPVQLVDERLTTVQGARTLREAGVSRQTRKAAIDRMAAQLILQQFLDQQRV